MSGKTDEDKKENKNGKIMITGPEYNRSFFRYVLIAVIIFLITGRQNPAEKEPVKRNIVVNENNAESVAEEMIEEAQEFVEPGY